MPPLLETLQLQFSYPRSAFTLVLAELRLAAGEQVAFIGPSGVGKTTLLYLLAGTLLPQRGQIFVDGTEITALDERARRQWRITKLGLVFQEFELLPYLTVLDNVLLPYRLTGQLRLSRDVFRGAQALLDRVGLDGKQRQYVGRLSQGERQRVAVCRALVTRPRLVLADEPTGSLDPDNKQRVLDVLTDDARQREAALVTVTHDHQLLERFDRVIDLGGPLRPPQSSPAAAPR